MKRTATLVAGLLLVTGTVFAGDWTVTGANVQGTFDLVNSQNGSLNSNGGDLDLTLKAEKDYGKAGVVGLKLALDKDADSGLTLTYAKTEGDFTVATAAKLIDEKGSLLNGDAVVAMNQNSDTYFKWNVMGSKTTSLTFYPYEVADMNWDNDTFKSFDSTNNKGGLKLATKIGTSDLAVKFTSKNDDSTTKNEYSVKGEFGTKVATATVNAAAGYSTGSKTTMMAIKASMPVAALTVNAEFNTEKVDTADAKVGVFVKGSYKLAEMNGYTPTAYASMKMLNKYVVTASGATTETEAGLDLNKGSFTITPKVILNTAENKVLGKEDSSEKSKNAMLVAVKVKYAM